MCAQAKICMYVQTEKCICAHNKYVQLGKNFNFKKQLNMLGCCYRMWFVENFSKRKRFFKWCVFEHILHVQTQICIVHITNIDM